MDRGAWQATGCKESDGTERPSISPALPPSPTGNHGFVRHICEPVSLVFLLCSCVCFVFQIPHRSGIMQSLSLFQ